MKKFILFVRRKPLGDETSLTRDASCEILNIWTRKPSVQKVVKRTAGQAGIVCGANIRRDVKISHSAVKQKVLNVSSGITALLGAVRMSTFLWLLLTSGTVNACITNTEVEVENFSKEKVFKIQVAIPGRVKMSGAKIDINPFHKVTVNFQNLSGYDQCSLEVFAIGENGTVWQKPMDICVTKKWILFEGDRSTFLTNPPENKRKIHSCGEI